MNKTYENSNIVYIVGSFAVLIFYLLFFSLNMSLSLEAVATSLVGNNLFISIVFTLLIIVAPEYIFNTVYTNLKENSKDKSLLTLFSILGIFFAVSFSLVSIWGTYESLYKITFGSVITSDKKINYEKELSEYKEKEKTLLNSISKLRDKILELPADYFTIRTQYENLLTKFNKELENLKLEKPKLIDDNTNNLSISKTFDDFGINFSSTKFLSILLLLSAFGLEVVLIMLSYNLIISFGYLYKNFKKYNINNDNNNLATNNDLVTNIDYIKNKNIKFILSCLESDNYTIKPIKSIMNEKNVTIKTVLRIIQDLKENNLILKNGKRLILKSELAEKLVNQS